ncbi:MAG: ATP-binding protein [Desulfocapsa sp.]|nr:ATP-binding protein [Desulfocapsa sp.]
MPIDEKYIEELLRLKGKYLYHREGQELEFKEQYNFGGLGDYFRDFAAFSNNKGGYMIFGVQDSPRIPSGLNAASLDQFNKIDPEKITGFLLEIFSPDILWEQAVVEHDGKSFGVFKIHEAAVKPIIAKKDEGRDQIIKNGEIYYRYGGRTQKILYAELENIINKKVEQNNNQWLDLMSKIGHAGPQNAAILDTEKALIEKGDARILVLDEELAGKLKFIKEGQFKEKEGAATLKLIGDIVPIDKVEVIKRVKENLVKKYPLAAMEMVQEVKSQLPSATPNIIWQTIKENDIKNDLTYSAYNFRNKKQEDNFLKAGGLLTVTPSIYNHQAVDFIVNIIKANA